MGAKGKLEKRANGDDSYDYYADPYDNSGLGGKKLEEEDGDEEFFQSQKQEASSRAKKKQRLAKSGSSTPQYTPTRFSSRTSRVVNYNIDHDNGDADLMDSEEEKFAEAEVSQNYVVDDPSGMSTQIPFLFYC